MFTLTLIACTGFNSEYGDDLLPTEDQIAINLPIASGVSSERSAQATEWAPYYDMTRNVTETVNGMVKFVLGTVGYVTTLKPSWHDDAKTTALWGPYSDSGLDPVETGLYVTRNDDGSYGWVIFQLPNGGDLDTDAVGIVAGEIDAGSTREDATGRFVVDFTTANTLDPAQNLVGTFSVEYDYDAEGVAGVAGFQDYGYENGQMWNAIYSYTEEYEGEGTMDFAWYDDLNNSGTDEIVALRSRWQADGAGRGDAFATGGDLNTTVVASNCWGTSFTTTYWEDSIGYKANEGAESACVYTPAEYAEEGDFDISAE